MRPLHERFLDDVAAERQRLSRRRVLAGSAKLAGGGALAFAVTAAPGRPGLAGVRAQDAFEDDVAVLNYALTLEHLEYAFYRDGLEQFTDADFGQGPFNLSISDFLAAIRDHEQAHVEALTATITDLGGDPVSEAEYDFGYTDAASFLSTAQALETTGVSAYDGAGQFLADPGLLTVAGTIVAVEARHSSYLNLINGLLPFPAAFEEPLTPTEVLDIAGPFIVAEVAAEGSDDAATEEAEGTGAEATPQATMETEPTEEPPANVEAAPPTEETEETVEDLEVILVEVEDDEATPSG